MTWFWNYNVLPLGAVTTWTDEIQSAPLNSQVGFAAPTNTSAGLFFLGTLGLATPALTNQPGFTTTTNFSFWMVVKPDASGANYSTLFTEGSTRGFWGPKVGGAWRADYYASGSLFFTGTIDNNVVTDILWVNPTGKGYTNGILSVTGTGKDTGNRLTTIGRDLATEYFGGHIKFIGIWTNTTLTATDAVNLRTWSLTH